MDSEKPQKAFYCPKCRKQRLIRDADFVLTDEMREIKLPNDDILEVPKDICSRCEENIIKRYFIPKKSQMGKVLKALHDDKVDLGDKSLEDML